MIQVRALVRQRSPDAPYTLPDSAGPQQLPLFWAYVFLWISVYRPTSVSHDMRRERFVHIQKLVRQIGRAATLRTASKERGSGRTKQQEKSKCTERAAISIVGVDTEGVMASLWPFSAVLREEKRKLSYHLLV